MKTIRLTGLFLLVALGLLRPITTYAISGPPPLTDLQIGFWDFDDTDWLTMDGNSPLGYTNLSNPSDWDGNALKIDSSSPAWLHYNIVEDTGATNLTFAQGTIQFWFLPDWNSSHGPNDAGRLIDVGQYGTNSTSSWWSLYFNTNGTNLSFSSVSNGVFTNYLTVPVSWASNNWHLIDLAYANTGSQLYIDGQLVTNGAASFYQPSVPVLTNGFFVGSDVTGTQQMRGQMDNLATFNYAVDAGFVTYAWAEATNTGTGDGTNLNNPAPDFGTNLFVSHLTIVSNSLSFVVSNTLNATYAIQTNSDLTTTNWTNDGQYIIGSDATNWTSFVIAIPSTTNNLFFRLQSELSSDNSGLPDWWKQKYFGTNDFNPNAQDSAGDGWTIYQKYALGLNPGTFYTPAAPQDLYASYNRNTGDGTVTWQLSPGPVTGYTLEKTYTPLEGSRVVQDFNLSASATNYVDTLAGESPNPYSGNYLISYRLQAVYSGGNSAWTTPIPLQQPTVTGSIDAGTNGTTDLMIAGLPVNAASVQLLFVDESALESDDSSFNYEADIPVSDFNNGVYQLPSNLQPTNDPTGDYYIIARTIGSNGIVNAGVRIDALQAVKIADYNWGQPFYDARRQMKDDLIFQLRAAPISAPLHFDVQPVNSGDPGVFGDYSGNYDYPSNYVYEGLYQFMPIPPFSTTWDGFDSTLPYEDNDRCFNFAFNSANVDMNGHIATGLQNGGSDYTILQNPLEYLFQTNGTPFPNILSTNDTRWLSYDSGGLDGSDGPLDPTDAGIASISGDDTSVTVSVTNGAVNWFGLPYVSALVAYAHYDADGNYIGVYTNVIGAGGSFTYGGYDVYFVSAQGIYPEAAQPQLSTAGYLFDRVDIDWLPGSSLFQPTNNAPSLIVQNNIDSPPYATNDASVIIAPVGQPTIIAGYAKLALENGYPGVYAFLGQYFDQSFEVDSNGIVTTNATGILSSYGQFIATQPGVAALTTMPDVDSGVQGTCMVYCVSLQLDKNHDGIMDTSLNGPDVTSTNSPFVFWCNNNFDRLTLDKDDNAYYDDDVESADCPATPGIVMPDYNYRDASSHRLIPSVRDLQDFARLWVCGVNTNLVNALPSGSKITLNWGDVGNPNSNNPTIDLFVAADPQGGIEYLTNDTVAEEQTNVAYFPYVGSVEPGQSLQLNASQFANNWAGNHFIWCGVENGNGQLNLTITDANGNVLGQTSVFIQIKDIKQMYERWTVGDDPSTLPATNAVLAADDGYPAGIPAFQYQANTDANMPYILYVHGWNMQPWEKDRFAESAFKRLYWQGYQGRFGVFRWPTDNGFKGLSSLATNPGEKDNYDRSEFNAWQSGQGLLNLLTHLNGEYPNNVYMLAHSMGNVVAGEALRLAANNQVVNTYVASQAAVSAHTYDTNVPNYSFSYPPLSLYAATPNIYGNWFSGNNGGGAGQVVSFYNTNDYALQRSFWQLNQLLKPDQGVWESPYSWDYAYNGTPNDPPPWNNFYKYYSSELGTHAFDIVNNLTNRYEVMAFAAQSWTTALGATAGITNLASLNLITIWPRDPNPNFVSVPYSEHFYHSAEFRGDYWQQQGYWNTLLLSQQFGFHITKP